MSGQVARPRVGNVVQRRTTRTSTHSVTIRPGQMDRISGSAQPLSASALRMTRILRGPGRSNASGGKGARGPRGNRRDASGSARPVPCPLRTISPAANRPGRSSNSTSTAWARSLGKGVVTTIGGGSRSASLVVQVQVFRAWTPRPERPVRAGRPGPSAPRATQSARLRSASGWRIGSSSNENGMWGRAISHEEVSPTVRTRAWISIRCGPFPAKSPGLIVNSARPGPGVHGVNASSPARSAPRMRCDHSRFAGVIPAPVLAEEREPVGDRDRDGTLERARIAAPGVPAHGEAAADHRLLLLGDELVLRPEHRQRVPRGMSKRLGLGRPEDAEQVEQPGPSVCGRLLDGLHRDIQLAEPGHRAPGSPSLEQLPPPAEEQHRAQHDEDGAPRVGEPSAPTPRGPRPGSTASRRTALADRTTCQQDHRTGPAPHDSPFDRLGDRYDAPGGRVPMCGLRIFETSPTVPGVPGLERSRGAPRASLRVASAIPR